MYKRRVEEAINDIKNGKMIIVLDNEDRENEADLVYAAEFSSPEKVNFLITNAKGLVCVSITKDIANKLNLPLMVEDNDSNHNTAFTVSIDAKEAKTGISAYERDLTIKLMCNEDSNPKNFVRPGHIFPLIANENGLLQRAGHTEASVEICKLANLKPIAVICEIIKEDGTMATNNDEFLMKMSNKYNLKILYISDLIKYITCYKVRK